VSHPLDSVAFEHSGDRCFVLILHPQDITKDLPDLLVIMLLLRGSELIHLALLENLKLSQLHAMFLLFKINKDFLPSVVLLRPERGSEHRRRPVPFRRDDLLADPAGQAAELLVKVVSEPGLVAVDLLELAQVLVYLLLEAEGGLREELLHRPVLISTSARAAPTAASTRFSPARFL